MEYSSIRSTVQKRIKRIAIVKFSIYLNFHLIGARRIKLKMEQPYNLLLGGERIALLDSSEKRRSSNLEMDEPAVDARAGALAEVISWRTTIQADCRKGSTHKAKFQVSETIKMTKRVGDA
ncbi:hypothetical protein SAY86_012761 [Trapa natans]|uniref:Uncharacterized protein n=1 Tax=Trapa natans TaxID=22666 RepID=A0AAN7MAL4_TRANT|nr:hypothetical protein SAY86_012761 [Trapa natans]